jgi:4-cresol dehydrogenase (hydroxylating)
MSAVHTRTFAAINAWTEALGPDKIAADSAVLGRYSRTLQDSGPCPCCILYPTSTEEVQAVVKVAGEHGVPVYPISRGKNWGYGDACAPTEGAAIVDLSRMNRIIEVNTELAYAVIEPGVSQGELHAYLKEHKTGLWMDCTGAGADSSLVGNTLDRGFGHTRYGDHFLTTCGMEVVLADGRVLNTGYGHYPNAKAARVYRYGVGPSLDGIFCQSNYGIVTRIGLWLMPEPEDFAFFLAQVDRDEDLAALVDALRPLRINGTLNTALHIGNDLRMFSTKRRYPWEEAGGVTPMPEELRARMRRSEGMGAWNAGSSISGTREQVKSTKRIIRKALKGVAKVRFVDDRLLSLGERVTGALSRFGLLKSLKEQLRALRPVYGLLKGQPAEEALVGTQWRLRRDPGNVLDPLENGSGLMWISPVLPMTGRAAREVMDIAEPIFRSFGFDPLATFTMINERAMIGILNVYYDKSDAKETQEAMACYDALVPALMKAGYIPYRVGLRGLPKVYNGGDVFWDVAQQIKRVLDPEDIIARGRYIPPQAPSK